MTTQKEDSQPDPAAPIAPPPLPPDFPDVPQNPGSELQPAPDPRERPDHVAGTKPEA